MSFSGVLRVAGELRLGTGSFWFGRVASVDFRPAFERRVSMGFENRRVATDESIRSRVATRRHDFADLLPALKSRSKFKGR